MTGGQQGLVAGGASDPVINWWGFAISIHDPASKPTETYAYVLFNGDGTWAYTPNDGTVQVPIGQFVTPASGVGSSNMQIIAQFVAGVTTYVTGPGLNVWTPLTANPNWGVLISQFDPGAHAANVILRFTLRNGWTGLQIGSPIDVNFDVQRV